LLLSEKYYNLVYLHQSLKKIFLGAKGMIFALIICHLIKFVFSCEQIIYPIASDGQKIYSIYQKKPNQKEIWAFDLQQNEAWKSLFANYAPSAIKLLPNLAGFSFIQDGQLRVKYFHKRSPKRVAFNFPLKDFHSVEWLDLQQCYFSARRLHKNLIMIGEINQAEVHVIMEDCFGDALFPQKIEDNLYYIRKVNDRFSVIKTKFLNPFENEDQHIVVDFLPDDDDLLLYDAGLNKILGFKMIDQNCGYLVMMHENLSDEFIKFSYHKICYNPNRAFADPVLAKNWQEKHLFDFVLNKNILADNSNQLDQIVEIFWPEHCLVLHNETNIISENIFFTSTASNGTMNIFKYDHLTSQVIQITDAAKDEHALRPILVGNKIYYGQCLKTNINESCDFNISSFLNSFDFICSKK
jgi:hypothetical protein